MTAQQTDQQTDRQTDRQTAAANDADGRMRDADDVEESPAAGTPLDLLLGDAARSPLRRFLPGMSGVRFTAGLARHPRRVAGRPSRSQVVAGTPTRDRVARHRAGSSPATSRRR